ncbi:hypothetical protein GDO86_007757 [Hymenochirus boettgeri]|uniref:Torsin-1A-interacting protein 1/2 AAA+ activator domain-containing protein n=1 Tax=Hymenochirus boettgeri TaxID=247094 RepID=A0A8T2IYU4_9PIPI|nr:hypothetical protein GDO86_007757 [Hymenochirus boettgeri]
MPQNKDKPTKSTSGFHLQGLIVTLALSVIPFYFIVYHWNFDNGSINDDKQHVLKYFHDQFNALESIYPSQSSHFWKRSRRALELHLNRSESNTQPAIILLTSARDAEQTLRCLSNKIAKIYSASRNMSYVFISGVNETFHDSDSAKLAIDDILTSSFQGTSSAAVMHQLEQLHPGALLILYKYCDHENAAFKNVAMVLTVLLDDLPHKPQLQLNEIEEKVRDFLAAKFSISNSERLHSEMDADKMGGVWSRISHLVLPVYPEDFLVECGSTEHGA